MSKNYLFLVSAPMSDYTLSDIQHCTGIKIINKCHVTNSKIANNLFRIHNAVKINKTINLPFRFFLV